MVGTVAGLVKVMCGVEKRKATVSKYIDLPDLQLHVFAGIYAVR